MKLLYLLTWLLLLPVTQAAQITGALRYNYDTTGTNTTSGAVTVTARTNLNSGTVNATNRVNVGRLGEQGTLTLVSTNGTYTVNLNLDADGTFTISYGSTNMLTVLVGANANNDGSPTNFLSAAGYYTNPAPLLNPTQFYVPVLGTNRFFDTGILYNPEDTGNALYSIFPDSVTNINRVTVYIQPFTGSGTYSGVGHTALEAWNFTSFTNQLDIWPPYNEGAGCVGGWFLADPGNGVAATTTNTVALALRGEIQPAHSRLNMGVLGKIGEVLVNSSQVATNVAVIGAIDRQSGATNTRSVAVYGEVRVSTASYFPVIENAIALFDAGDSGFPGLVVRTGNASTNLMKVDYTTTAGETGLWLWDADNSTLEHVTVGIADSGGAGFKVLRIPN